MRFGTLFIVAVLSRFVVFAQPQAPNVEWMRTYGGSGFDDCRALLQTADGGYLLAGTTTSFGAGDYDAWVLKTDLNGDSMWSQTFGGGGDDGWRAVCQTPDGGYAFAGKTESQGAGSGDFWLLRTDADGDSLWSRTYGGPGWETCWGMRQTPDGGFLLAGWTRSVTGQKDFWLVRTNENGDSLWSRAFGGSDEEECLAIINTLDSGYLLVGWTASFGAGGQDFWIVKTNSNGDSLWARVYGTNATDVCWSAVQAADGGYLLGGWTWTSESDMDFWLVKTDADGNGLWTRRFGGTDWDVCSSVIGLPYGYALGGYTYSLGAGSSDAWLIRTDLNGDSLWSLTIGGDSADHCWALGASPDGGYVLAGRTKSFRATDYDFWLVKTGPELAAATPPLAREFTYLTNYPSPFNARTTVEFVVPRRSRVVIRAVDLLGREVGLITDAPCVPGRYAIPWECRNCASGAYWIMMTGDGFQLVRKTILLR